MFSLHHLYSSVENGAPRGKSPSLSIAAKPKAGEKCEPKSKKVCAWLLASTNDRAAWLHLSYRQQLQNLDKILKNYVKALENDQKQAEMRKVDPGRKENEPDHIYKFACSAGWQWTEFRVGRAGRKLRGTLKGMGRVNPQICNKICSNSWLETPRAPRGKAAG